MNPTPRPWKVVTINNSFIEGPNEESIAVLDGPLLAQRHTNADLIVRVVNGYDQLVERNEHLMRVCDAMREALQSFPLPSISKEENQDYYSKIYDWYDNAKAALVLAEGKEGVKT